MTNKLEEMSAGEFADAIFCRPYDHISGRLKKWDQEDLRAELLRRLGASGVPEGQWFAADYDLSARIHDAAEAITKRLTEHAVRLAIIRHDLLSFNPDARDEELTEDEVVTDLVDVALGEDTGCHDPDSLDATNCEVLFVEAELRKLAPVPARKHIALPAQQKEGENGRE